jgi:hypothetical protein
MNEITLPLLITIAVVGIIGIVLVKLFYNDDPAPERPKELPEIITSHWQESFDEDTLKSSEEEASEYGFVSKSWEEPMEPIQESDTGIAAKVFQEPMHTKHQDIISNEYENKDKSSDEEYFDDLTNENEIYRDSEDENSVNNDTNNENNHINDNDTNTTNIDSNDNDQIDSAPVSEYITPKKYHHPSNDNDEYYDDFNVDNTQNKNNNYRINRGHPSYNDNKEKNNSLELFGDSNMSEQIIIEGKAHTIRVGDEIIFNYNRESYSSRILDIKHENIKVKYRSREKWINFSDVKKVF